MEKDEKKKVKALTRFPFQRKFVFAYITVLTYCTGFHSIKRKITTALVSVENASFEKIYYFDAK